MDNILKYIQCPNCRQSLAKNESGVYCPHCGKTYPLKNGILTLGEGNISDKNCWDNIYENNLKNRKYLKEYDWYRSRYFQDIYNQINECRPIKSAVYLEIGCGQFFFGSDIAHEADFVIGIDFSLGALKIAKEMLERKGAKNYLLIQGNIDKMPIIKDNSIDIIYGGGVIEHFEETQECLNEIHRVLAPGGLSFNTVPYLNIASLTYRQLWGNIPDCPIIKPLAKFFHMKILGARHMRFGMEKSFTRRKMRKMHEAAGFSNITSGRFKAKLDFEYITFKPVRKVSIYLAENFSLFWPMIKVIAKK